MEGNLRWRLEGNSLTDGNEELHVFVQRPGKNPIFHIVQQRCVWDHEITAPPATEISPRTYLQLQTYDLGGERPALANKKRYFSPGYPEWVSTSQLTAVRQVDGDKIKSLENADLLALQSVLETIVYSRVTRNQSQPRYYLNYSDQSYYYDLATGKYFYEPFTQIQIEVNPQEIKRNIQLLDTNSMLRYLNS